MLILSLLALLLCLIPLGYWIALMLASFHKPVLKDTQSEKIFAIAIAAHNEETVIASTVERLLGMEYPTHLFSVHIVADHCSDHTAESARRAGAVVHERNDGPRNGKGAALSWLFRRILEDRKCDAVVIFDADTRVDKKFLSIMNSQLMAGEQIVQGRHVISNPEDGWFPALTWAMFMIDNRFQNLGRVNLGWSAKNMGDSICISADALRKVGWGDGLADDYQLRQKFLLSGIKIAYEPSAVGLGEAPLTWKQAQVQRARWIRGAYDADQQHAATLLKMGIKNRDMALLDGALQAYLPSYSMLTAFILVVLLLHFVAYKFGMHVPALLIAAWVSIFGIIFLYPFIGLALEKAPLKAYLVILTGPIFIVWRIWLSLVARFGKKDIVWVRTAHKG